MFSQRYLIRYHNMNDAIMLTKKRKEKYEKLRIMVAIYFFIYATRDKNSSEKFITPTTMLKIYLAPGYN